MSLSGSPNNDNDPDMNNNSVYKSETKDNSKASRYPSLGPKRRPPNRAALVKAGDEVHKYERLEDLLREAGYKETRIFTPDATPEPNSKKHSSAESGNGSRVGGMVGFLSSFVGGGSSRPPSRVDNPVTPLTPSPSPHRRAYHWNAPSSPSPSSSSSAKREVPKQMRVVTTRNESPISQAHAYLKHMASAPNLPRRSKSTLTVRNANGHPVGTGRRTDKSTPPLPKTWLETVARAVLYGPEEAHMGQPPSPPRFTISPTLPLGEQLNFHPQSPHARGLGLDMQSSFYSSSSQGVSSSSSRGRSLDVQIGDNKLMLRESRAARMQGTVCLTRVTCQSAPTSRSNSRVRGGRERRNRTKEQEPPSLAKTKTEGDAWGADGLPSLTKSKRNKHPANLAQRYKAGWGYDPPSHSEVSSDSEGEGELNLDRLLIPPKRQNSIRSLRRHLTLKDSISDLRRSLRPSTPGVNEEDEDDEGRIWHRFANGDRKRGGVPRWN